MGDDVYVGMAVPLTARSMFLTACMRRSHITSEGNVIQVAFCYRLRILLEDAIGVLLFTRKG